ncbi:MAG TPA: DUF1569 domain-containing protein [Bacteroidia bacterium]|jgi:hypothetical protein|nr:DUF1569 domain-containing protein [Bacteroidia bacterium]
MKTVFDKETREELIRRIQSLNTTSKAQWGKMNVYQMIKHCAQADEMFLGKKKYKRVPLGYLLGKSILKRILKDDSPMEKNAPTHVKFRINGEGDIAPEKIRWMEYIGAYAQFSEAYYVHWFFGKMTKEQLGYLAYKHTDHHLRQFNA